MARVETKLQLLRDRVIAVAKGYATGLYLHGGGGVGKSYTVLRALQHIDADCVTFNSRMTGRGLFDQLQKFPGSVHVLEDMEAFFSDKGAQGLLRRALWGQRREGAKGPLERRVTWTTHRKDEEFLFTGGIIVIGNRSIDDTPELRAVKTRIDCLHLDVSPAEITALIRHVASKGHDHQGMRLEPGVCLEVCEYLIHEALSVGRSLDMRLLINSFNDRLQWEEADVACHWKDLVAGRLRERPTAHPEQEVVRSRERRKQQERAIIAEILVAVPDRQDRLRLWAERTGKSQAAYYRRAAELATEQSSRLGM